MNTVIISDLSEGSHVPAHLGRDKWITTSSPERLREDFHRFNWSDWPLSERLKSHETAYRIEPKAFQLLMGQGRIPSRHLARLYDSTEIQRVFRKILIKNIQQYYELWDAWELLKSEQEVILKPSENWWDVHKILLQAGLLSEDYLAASKAATSNPRGEGALRRIAHVAMVPFWVLTRIRRIRLKVVPRHVLLAIRLCNTDHGFREDSKQRIDWPVDGETFDKSNTVLFGETNLPDQYLRDVENSGYQFVDATRRGAFFSVSLRFLISDLFLKVGASYFGLLTELWSAPRFFQRGVIEGLIDWLRWRALTEAWQPAVHVAYNDISLQHIYRNVMLESLGCRTVFYQHTNSNYAVYYRQPDLRGLYVNWAYLYHHLEAHWNKQQIELWEESGTRAIIRKAYGSFWSEQVQDRHDLVNSLPQSLRKPEGPAIAIFNTSLWNNSLNGAEFHRSFFEGLLKLLEEEAFRAAAMVIKPKKPFDVYLQHSDQALVQAASKFMNHPRTYIADSQVDVGAVIGWADLTITMSFASPTVEALNARRRAIFFDPLDRYPSAYFRKFPGLVALSSSHLTETAQRWIGYSEQELNDYLELNFFPAYGPGSDTAANYFRRDIGKLARAETI